MAQSGNDIIISAKAQTAEAEAGLKRLDAKIQDLAKSDSKIQKVEKSLEKFGKTAKKAATNASQQATLMSTSMTALEGSLAGLGVGVLAFAGSALTYAITNFGDFTKTAEAASQRAKAWTDLVNQSKEETDKMVASLRQLDELARDGYIDNDSIQISITLVQQLAEKFGDVGLQVDKATGRVKGLEEGISAINAKTREAQLNAARAEERAAKQELEAIQRKHKGENGSDTWYGQYYGNVRMFMNNPLEYATSLTDEGYNAMHQKKMDTQKAEVLAAKGKIQAAQAKVQELEGATAQEKINEVAGRAKASADRKKFDSKGLQLQNNLASAINSGNSNAIESARKELDNHNEELKRKQLEDLNAKIETAKKEKEEADADLAKRRRNVQEDKQNARIDRANNATAHLNELMKQRDGLMSSIKVPTAIVESATKATVDKIATSSNGTFDSRSLGSLGQNTVEKEQLEQLKEIAKNTKDNNQQQPVVGE